MTDRTENWKRVPGHPGYVVSDLGRVASIDRYVTRCDGQLQHRQGRMLVPTLDRDGYERVKVGGGATIHVHILVLLAFAGSCPPGMEALHGPGGKLDNRWPESGLHWGTRSENILDRHRDGAFTHAKLNAQIVASCRIRYASGESAAALGREVGVSSDAMWRAVTGKTWGHVQ